MKHQITKLGWLIAATVSVLAAATPAVAHAESDTVATPPALSGMKVARPDAPPSVLTAGYFRIINQASGKCLTPWGSGDGTAITQVTCNGGNSQWWLLDPGSVGTIVNYATGKCLDLWGNLAGDGQLVFTWSCYGANSQRWRPVNAGGQYYELRAYYTDQCLDLANGVARDGAIIQQWGCHAFNNNQHWWLG